MFIFPQDLYASHIHLVDLAERYLADMYGPLNSSPAIPKDAVNLAALRKSVGVLAGVPVLSRPSCAMAPGLAQSMAEMAKTGTVTPEHVIQNKPFLAFWGNEFQDGLDSFAQAYQGYFDPG